MALEVLSSPRSHDHYLDFVPELPWEKVGGQEEALQAIKDAIELPLLHEGLFKRFQHATPKGFLLYGPPGCGKTLIGKATAYNLTKQLRGKPAMTCVSISCTSKARRFSHVGGGIGADGARNFCDGARRNGAKASCRFYSSTKPRAFSHTPRVALRKHSFHARSDVLHGNGRIDSRNATRGVCRECSRLRR